MTTQIVVLGAGYAGQLAARWLGRDRDVEVTLVNERDQFVERVRLHQLAAGEELRHRPLTELMKGSGVRVVIDRAVAVDPSSKSVVLAAGEALPY
ncbi:FAD-dependent oxidoreductase, partial [Actinophytocola sp.]|uniref:FAD-dependent oxidoreductase n=1 Tax=Actinophytocola sp. TaxID=1872138 RepID=UPI00389A8480